MRYFHKLPPATIWEEVTVLQYDIFALHCLLTKKINNVGSSANANIFLCRGMDNSVYRLNEK